MNTESDPLDLESNNSNEDTTSSTTKNLLEEYLPIDDHVELVSEGGQKVPRKGIYLLPNLFTSAALFAGFFAIISAINLQFVAAGLAIFFGQLLDGVDGRVARLTKTQSKFGQEFDSLSDMVTFGIAPAIIIFMWCLSDIGKVGWAVGFIYVASAAIRLARFNAQVGYADDRYFSGLASPPAATLLASSVWLAYDSGYSPADLPTLMVYSMMFLTIFIGLLMVVNVPYYSFKNINLSGRVSLVALLIFIFLLVLIASNPPKVLFILALTYALSGPFYLAIKKIKG